MFLGIANLIFSIAYITLYGSFVDEGAVFSENALFVSFCIFLCIFSISSFLYQKKMWMLFFIYSVLLIASGIYAFYYDTLIFGERGFHVYGGIAPSIIIGGGIVFLTFAYMKIKARI